MFNYITSRIHSADIIYKKSSNYKNTSWLLTCSDLFFLLFAFFVLNHSIVSEKKVAKKLTNSILTMSEVESNGAIVHYLESDEQTKNIQENFFYEVDSKWFSSEENLSVFGNTQLASLKKIMASSTASFKIRLELPSVSDAKKPRDLLKRVLSMLKLVTPKTSPIYLKVNPQLIEAKISVEIDF